MARLLSRVLDKYRTEICNRYQIDHPSQMQHECLFEMPEYFLQQHYDSLLKRLWTARFIPTIQRVLEAHHIHVSDYRVHGASEAFPQKRTSEKDALEKELTNFSLDWLEKTRQARWKLWTFGAKKPILDLKKKKGVKRVITLENLSCILRY